MTLWSSNPYLVPSHCVDTRSSPSYATLTVHTRWLLSCSLAVSGRPPIGFDANSCRSVSTSHRCRSSISFWKPWAYIKERNIIIISQTPEQEQLLPTSSHVLASRSPPTSLNGNIWSDQAGDGHSSVKYTFISYSNWSNCAEAMSKKCQENLQQVVTFKFADWTQAISHRRLEKLTRNRSIQIAWKWILLAEEEHVTASTP